MSEYSIGIEDHYAWANLVSVTTSGPNEILLDKRRVELLDQQLTASPYHHETLQMPVSGAEKLVRDVQTSAGQARQIGPLVANRRTRTGKVSRHRDPSTSASRLARYGRRGSREYLDHESR